MQFAKPGSPVNLERPLRAGGELGGHFVTGHVDGIGKIIRWESAGKDHVLGNRRAAGSDALHLFKGSIAVDGISLTVGGREEKKFPRLDHPAHV